MPRTMEVRGTMIEDNATGLVIVMEAIFPIGQGTVMSMVRIQASTPTLFASSTTLLESFDLNLQLRPPFDALRTFKNSFDAFAIFKNAFDAFAIFTSWSRPSQTILGISSDYSSLSPATPCSPQIVSPIGLTSPAQSKVTRSVGTYSEMRPRVLRTFRRACSEFPTFSDTVLGQGAVSRLCSLQVPTQLDIRIDRLTLDLGVCMFYFLFKVHFLCFSKSQFLFYLRSMTTIALHGIVPILSCLGFCPDHVLHLDVFL